MITSYPQAKKYFDSFINYELKPSFSYGNAFKLRRVAYLFKLLGIPRSRLKVLHIAGTKGKGSVAFLCAHLLSASGFKTGLYTSPHFFDLRERIRVLNPRGQKKTGLKRRISRGLISRKDFTRIAKNIERKVGNRRLSSSLGRMTFFEILTAAGFWYFLDKQVDYAVLETGLGGRLDATNIAKPQVTILTHIGYDHTDKLGEKLKNIAREKAGIIKRGVPVVCAPQRSSAQAVINGYSRLRKAPLYVYGRNFQAKNIKIKKKHTLFDFIFGEYRINGVKIYLKGAHQVENACCALAAVSLLPPPGGIKGKICAKRGVSAVDCAGRFEVIKGKIPVVLDIAHNRSSFMALRDSLDVYFPAKKVILIFACSRDKDFRSMLKVIRYERIVVTKFHGARAASPEEVKNKSGLKEAVIAGNIKQALAAAKNIAGKDSLIVVSGSFFLVAEAMRVLGKQKVSTDEKS